MERPKSAMRKEDHPEYDPHEPMITSAFSDEDLRKSRDDIYDESYKNETTDDTFKDYNISHVKSTPVTPSSSKVNAGPRDKLSGEFHNSF